jgi:hypothetical protein
MPGWPRAGAEPYPVQEKVFERPGHPRAVLRFARVGGRLVLVNVEIGVDVGLRLPQDEENIDAPQPLHIDAPKPLPVSATRLPLRAWALEYLGEKVEFMEQLAAGEILKGSPHVVAQAKERGVPVARADLAAAKRSPGRPQTPLAELERAAAIYAEAFAAGLPPTKTVAEQLNLSRSAAAKRVARAREHGLLAKTTPRVAGGVKGANDAE